MKTREKVRGEFFHHMQGEWVIKGGKQKGNILSSFSFFFLFMVPLLDRSGAGVTPEVHQLNVELAR